MVSLSKIKRYLDIEKTDYDTVLTELEDIAAKRIENFCNQAIESTSETWYTEGNSEDYIVLPNFPVTALTSVHYREKPSDSWTEITCTLYEVDGTNFIFYDSGFTQEYYKIIYTYGYSTIPKDIQGVCLEMVKILFEESNNSDKSRLGLSSVSSSGGAAGGIEVQTNFLDLRPRWKKELSKYRRPVV